MLYLSLTKVFLASASAFFVGIIITPFLTNFLYKHKCWKKTADKIDPLGNSTPIFNELDKERAKRAPRMGGIIIWSSVLIITIIFGIISYFFPDNILSQKLNFLSRNQTWLPLFTLIFASLLGLADDILQVTGEAGAKSGLSFYQRLSVVVILGLIGGYWFYFKLGMVAIALPFLGSLYLGWLIIPLFILIMIALFSSGVIDGLDGLSGGVMAIIFASYTVIAFFQGQFDLAAFCGAVTGGLLAFLWFNIPPARFYMSETGILGLTTALTVVAFLTDSVATLPIIALPLVATVLSVVIQLASKKLRHGKKVFLVAPLHHHFEALGWPAYKVVMRYWVIGIIFAIIGLIITLIGGPKL
jgi:phospho-N-acetylmuramoyl-pentapeptide-transferase